MTEYEIQKTQQAILRALEVGAPNLSEIMRQAIADNAILRLRHEFNVPAQKLEDISK